MTYRHRTYEEIKAVCEAQGVPFNDDLYRLHGWDTVVVGSRKPNQAYAAYNTLNGRYFGRTPEGEPFDSHDGQNKAVCKQLDGFFWGKVWDVAAPTPATSDQIDRARRLYEQLDEIEIDDGANASETPNGVWVQAWVFVNSEELE